MILLLLQCTDPVTVIVRALKLKARTQTKVIIFSKRFVGVSLNSWNLFCSYSMKTRNTVSGLIKRSRSFWIKSSPKPPTGCQQGSGHNEVRCSPASHE